MKVDFYRHQLTEKHGQAMAAVVASPFLTTGKIARGVEEQLCGYFDVPHAALVNSWTNGAVAMLLALDIGPGDEVIVPAATFIATANVVELVGATPVFADVDPGTLLMESTHVRERLSARTRAVIPVHLYGQMCDIASLRGMLDTEAENNVSIIEDCAHCFEGSFNNERPGQHSDAAIFSFYATKNITCGEGGAIILRNTTLHEKLLQSRLHGMSAIAVDRFRGGHYNHWDMERLGTKANLPDLLAALLPDQIAEIESRLPERHQLARRYNDAFAGGPLRLVEPRAGCRNAHHLYTIGVPKGQRDEAIAALNAAEIGVTVNYRAVTEMTYYHERYPQASSACPVSVKWGTETLSLPLFPGLQQVEQDHVIRIVEEKIYPLIAT